MTRLTLEEEHRHIVVELLRQHVPEREVRAFGSRVTGGARAHSDLDLVIMGEEPLDDLTLAMLRADLEESDLPFRVDVLLWKDTPPALRAAIEHDSEVLFHEKQTVEGAM